MAALYIYVVRRVVALSRPFQPFSRTLSLREMPYRIFSLYSCIWNTQSKRQAMRLSKLS